MLVKRQKAEQLRLDGNKPDRDASHKTDRYLQNLSLTIAMSRSGLRESSLGKDRVMRRAHKT